MYLYEQKQMRGNATSRVFKPKTPEIAYLPVIGCYARNKKDTYISPKAKQV